MKQIGFLKKLTVKAIINALLLLSAINYIGCSKEYSYEGGSVNITHDSLPPPPPVIHELPLCSLCAAYPDPLELNQWSLKAGNSSACGILDTAIINLERTAFTFFGPSACSRDTGLVMTVYVENETLNHDITNLSINRVAFYYYDRVTPSYIYMSGHNIAFSVQIDSYKHQTRILTGSFRGSVLRTNGNASSITEGRFKIKLL